MLLVARTCPTEIKCLVHKKLEATCLIVISTQVLTDDLAIAVEIIRFQVDLVASNFLV